MDYTVVENTPRDLLEDPEPFVGSSEDCARVMDEIVTVLVKDGYTVVFNEGCGCRLHGGTRRAYLQHDDSDLGRVVEILPADIERLVFGETGVAAGLTVETTHEKSGRRNLYPTIPPSYADSVERCL